MSAYVLALLGALVAGWLLRGWWDRQRLLPISPGSLRWREGNKGPGEVASYGELIRGMKENGDAD